MGLNSLVDQTIKTWPIFWNLLTKWSHKLENIVLKYTRKPLETWEFQEQLLQGSGTVGIEIQTMAWRRDDYEKNSLINITKIHLDLLSLVFKIFNSFSWPNLFSYLLQTIVGNIFSFLAPHLLFSYNFTLKHFTSRPMEK